MSYKERYNAACRYALALTLEYNKLLEENRQLRFLLTGDVAGGIIEERYNPNQPRDEKGRWSSSGGGISDNQNELIKAEIESIGIYGEINIPPKEINTDGLSFDNEHINEHNVRNISEQDAKNYIETAKISFSKWNGEFENYYSSDGASFVNTKENSIRTAFTKNEYTENVNRMMEVFDKYGK